MGSPEGPLLAIFVRSIRVNIRSLQEQVHNFFMTQIDRPEELCLAIFVHSITVDIHSRQQYLYHFSVPLFSSTQD